MGRPAARPERRAIENIYDPGTLFDHICKTIENRLDAAQENMPEEKIKAMTDYIKENLHRDISLSDLSDSMNVSYAYASMFFKNKTGMNFVDYLQTTRIAMSQTLLAETEKNIDVIAADTGFISVNTFYRVFKKCVGTTPAQYRAERKKQLKERKA